MSVWRWFMCPLGRHAWLTTTYYADAYGAPLRIDAAQPDSSWLVTKRDCSECDAHEETTRPWEKR